MKRLRITLIGMTLFCVMAVQALGLSVHTNTATITLYADGGNEFKQFNFRSSGYQDQYVNFTLSESATGVTPMFKMSYPAGGSTTSRTTVLLIDGTNIAFTVSGTSISFFVDRTN